MNTQNNNINNSTFKELVGEMIEENIPELDKIPSFEEIYGGEMAAKLIERLKKGGTLIDGVYELIKNGNNVNCKMLFKFKEKNESIDLVQSKGKTLKLPSNWIYTLNNSNDAIVEFVIK